MLVNSSEQLKILSGKIVINEKGKINKEDTPCTRCQCHPGIEKQIGILSKQLMLHQNLEGFDQLMEQNWEKGNFIFKRTSVKEGNPIQAKNGDFVLIKGDKDEKSNLTNIFQNRFPEVGEISEDLQRGDLEHFQVTSTFRGTKVSTVYITNIIEKEISTLQKMKTEIINRKTKVLNLAATSSYDWQRVRKILEIVFHENEDIHIVMYVPKKGKNTQKREVKRDDIITVKSGTTTYSDMVKNVRDVIDPDTLGVPIKYMKKSGNTMQIATEKGKGNILRSEIRDKVKDTEVSVREDKISIQISYIEEDLTREDIIEDIQKNEGCDKITADDMRSVFSTKRGYQVAILYVDKNLAQRILQKGKIKIGWIHCTVKKRISTERCMNCLGVGHRAINCKQAPNQETRCFNCTKPGHKASECTEKQFCESCKKEGHTNNSARCPQFRRYMKRKRDLF
jgi:Arginine methyltransferase-interacting protein, contains RING Zn-finger